MGLNIKYLMKNKCNFAIVEGNTIRPCGKYSEDCIYDKNDKIWDYYCSEHYSKVKEDKINNEKSTENKEGCGCSKNECGCCRYRSELCCEDKKNICNCQMGLLYKDSGEKNIVCLIHKQHTKYSK